MSETSNAARRSERDVAQQRADAPAPPYLGPGRKNASWTPRRAVSGGSNSGFRAIERGEIALSTPSGWEMVGGFRVVCALGGVWNRV